MAAKADRRVLILAELASLFTGMSIELTGTGLSGSTPSVIPPGNFVRNRNELPKEKVPGVILLDGDETRDRQLDTMRAGRQLPPGPGMMMMVPEIYVVLDVRKPGNLNVGEDLNAARLKIINAILHDPILQTIVGSNGWITYDGAITDLARNREMIGQIGMSFTFCYPFIPGELEPQ